MTSMHLLTNQNTSWWHNNSGLFFNGPVTMILSLLLWVILFYLILKVIQAIIPTTTSEPASHLDILKKRYAKGEISEEYFKRIKAELL